MNQPEERLRGGDIHLPLVDSIGAIRSHSAVQITWHSHRRFELLCVLDGATTYEFRGGRAVELSGDHFIVVPPHLVHRGLHNVRMPATLCGVSFDPRHPTAQRNTPFTTADLAWLAGQFEAHALTTHPMSSELRRLVAALNRQVRALRKPDGADAASLRLLVCAVILEAARQITAARPARAEQAVAAAVAHLQKHLHEPVMMNHLAKQAGCGRARLFQLFKQTTGQTPNDYLQRLRVAKARGLLTATSQSITEIAFAVGFASSQYFSRVFRKYTGQMPSEYRRRHRR